MVNRTPTGADRAKMNNRRSAQLVHYSTVSWRAVCAVGDLRSWIRHLLADYLSNLFPQVRTAHALCALKSISAGQIQHTSTHTPVGGVLRCCGACRATYT